MFGLIRSVQKPTLSFCPFQKVAVDLVCEIQSPYARGDRVVPSLVDACSRWIETLPLKYTTTKDVAEELFYIFYRMGFLCVILSDNGTQFVSRTMRSFTDMHSIVQIFRSCYHPSSNGIV